MNVDWESRAADWDARPFDGGYAGLRELADDGFSGVVTADGDVRLFMLNGHVLGVFDGSIDAFEGASGSARVAPDPALPLLFAMLEGGGDPRAKYYTNDTPLSEVDRTLSEGGFTGYVELSENVLSGDYYVVYQGGKSMSAAFVGSSGRLITGEEAFQRAEEEVGIYEVVDVDLEVIDIPAPDEGDVETAQDAGTGAGAVSVEEPALETEADSSAATDEVGAEAEDASPVETGDAGPVEAETDVEPVTAVEEDSDPADTGADAPDSSAKAGVVPADTDADAANDEGEAVQTDAERPSAAGRPSSATEVGEEATRIPSLDPDHTSAADEGAEPDRTEPRAAGSATPSSPEDETSAADEEPERRVERLREQLATARTERDDLEREVERLRSELRELRERAERLAAERDRLAERLDEGGPDAERSIDPGTALDETNLFVRYRSKAEPTLEAAHAGEATREAVNENLRLEYHTGFDAEAVAVDGRPFEAFLTETIEYRCVDWIVRDLLYEIADTGHAGGLSALFDAIPEIDRAELNGSVALRYVEDGEEVRERREFDVVLRDRMGNPLFVVDVNDERDPATQEMMVDLVTAANRTKESADGLAGAFLVTTSFFDPGALETAAEATSSGLLGGGSRESFVKLSRKRGYHLCLVEARDDDFHVTVPEL